MIRFFLLVEKIISSVFCALKCIFHCHAHNLVLSRSLFSSAAVVFTLRTTEKRKVSSAKSFTSLVILLGKSMIYKRKNRGPNTELWGTPADTVFHSELFPFNTALCSRFMRKLVMKESRPPDIPQHSSLYSNPSCHALSNASDRSRNTVRVSSVGVASKAE